MTIVFIILAILTIAGTGAAMALRNPIHCILALTVGLVGLATLFLDLGAQFVGFTQIIVYVGAVAILAVFAIMMTQGGKPPTSSQPHPKREMSATTLSSGIVAVAVFAVLAWAISSSRTHPSPAAPEVTVNQIGHALMQQYVLPLEIMGLLLTAALIGAVIVAMPQEREKP